MKKLLSIMFILTVSLLFLMTKISDSFETSDLPDLVVKSVSNPPASIKGDKKFTVKDTTMNQGLKKAGKSVTRYYLSVDVVKDDNDILLKGRRRVKALKPGKSSGGETKVTVPNGTLPGNYYLIACADDTKKVTESDETNNCMSSSTTMLFLGPSVITYEGVVSYIDSTDICTCSGCDGRIFDAKVTIDVNGDISGVLWPGSRLSINFTGTREIITGEIMVGPNNCNAYITESLLAKLSTDNQKYEGSLVYTATPGNCQFDNCDGTYTFSLDRK
jgi:hypothetical protein